MKRIPDDEYKPDPTCSPWLQGKEAFWDRRPVEVNPYHQYSAEWNEWLDGYREAEKDAEEGR